MYYEINVAERDKTSGEVRYRYLFATSKLTTRDDVRRVLPKLQAAFPEPAYKLSVMRREEISTSYHPTVFLKD